MRALSTTLLSAAMAMVLIGCPSKSDDGGKKPPPPTPSKQAPPPPPPPEAPPPAAADGGKGSVAGTISFKGKAPAAKKVDMKAKPDCVKLNKDPMIQLVNADGGKLSEVYVHVKEGLPDDGKFDTKEETVVLDQKGCMYHPPVLAVQVKQPFQILNSDPTLHNVNVQGKRDKYNLAMPKQGMKIDKKFKKPDVSIPVKCDAHPWMEAQIHVAEHPFFALSGKDGTFKIEGLPAGKYKLEFVHWTLGTQTKDVTVEADKSATVDVTFESKG